MADEHDGLPDEELEAWDRIAREGPYDRENRHLGSVARDRKIRRLIEEVRRERARSRGGAP
jgi:hypothetical protein